MAIHVYDTDTITGISIINTSNTFNGDLVFVTEGTNLVSGTNNTISLTSIDFTNLDFLIDGNLISQNDTVYVINDADVAAVYTFEIGENARIFSTDRGMYLGGGTSSYVDGGRYSVDNAGEITGVADCGILGFYTENFIVTNSGKIQSTLGTDAVFANGVRLFDVTNASIYNSGTIASGSTNVNGKFGGAVSFSDGTDNVLLINSGTITGALTGVFSEADVSEEINNAGTINGNVTLSAAVGGTMVNTGLINGDIDTRGGEDVMANGGTITGDVMLGSGADVYTTLEGGLVLGEIQGGTGNDTITTGAADDRIDGGENNDRIKSKDGDDIVKGGDGNDNIMAGNGDDEIIAGTGADILRGGTGDDTLNGGSGNDTLKGGSGDDILEGGKNVDILTGGAGADIFLFKVASHSTVANRDTITDFMKGSDLIDISAFDATFISNAGFTGGGTAEVRFGTGGSLTRIEVDTDGNGTADFRVDMGDIGGLSEADFIL